MNLLPIAIPLAIAAILAVVFLVRRHERERTEGLRDFARGRGFRFQEKGDLTHLPSHLLKHGQRRRMKNVMSREEVGAQILVFDHEYLTQHGDKSHWDRETVFCARRDGRSLPVFQMRPENVMDRLASALGWRDIDFDNRPDFSRTYLLRGPDESLIRQTFGVESLAFFEKHAGWHVEAEGGWVAVYHGSKRISPDACNAFLEEARQVDEIFRA